MPIPRWAMIPSIAPIPMLEDTSAYSLSNALATLEAVSNEITVMIMQTTGTARVSIFL